MQRFLCKLHLQKAFFENVHLERSLCPHIYNRGQQEWFLKPANQFEFLHLLIQLEQYDSEHPMFELNIFLSSKRGLLRTLNTITLNMKTHLLISPSLQANLSCRLFSLTLQHAAWLVYGKVCIICIGRLMANVSFILLPIEFMPRFHYLADERSRRLLVEGTRQC